MATTLVRKVQLKITADDGDTEAKLAQISAKADELAAKHPELKVRIETAAASAKLGVLRKELKATADTSVDAKTRLGALGQALNSLTLGVSGGWGAMTMFQKAIAGLGVVTGLGEPLMAGLTVAVGGLSAGLLSAGLGLGAFGAVAKSNFTVANTAANQVQTAQIAYNASVAHGVKQATAYRAEQIAIAKAYAQLSPAQIAMANQLNGVQNSWQSFVQANTAGVDKIMTKGIGLLPKVFSTLQVFMAPTEKALGGLVSQLGKGLGSSGFKDWIGAFAKASGPNITNLGQAIGHIVVGIGGVLKAFLPMATTMTGGLDHITAAFAKWGTTLSGHTGFASLMSTFKSETPQAVAILKNLAAVLKNVVAGMAGLSTGSNSKSLLQVLLPLSGILEKLSKNTDLVRLALYLVAAADAGKKLKIAFTGIQGAVGGLKAGASALQDLKAGFSNSAAAASDATGIWGTFGGKISTAVTAIKGWGIWSKVAAAATRVWTGIQAAFDVVMDANPIVLVVIAIAALVAGVILAYQHFGAFRDFVKTVFRDVTEAVGAAVDWVRSHWPLLLAILTGPIGLAVLFVTRHWKQVTGAFSDALKWVRSHWPLILAILTGPIGLATLYIVRHWSQIYNGAKSMIDKVVGFFEKLPGRILNALASLGKMMFDAGVHAIQRLIDGIGSMIGRLGSVMGSIASKVAGFIGLSPAKEGPLSGGGAPEIRGRHISEDIARGMTSRLPHVAASAARLAGAAALGAAASPALAGAGAGGRLQVEWVGGQSDQQFITWIKKNIRIRGGDVSNVGR